MKKVVLTLGFLTVFILGTFNVYSQNLSVTPGTLSILPPCIIGAVFKWFRYIYHNWQWI